MINKTFNYMREYGLLETAKKILSVLSRNLLKMKTAVSSRNEVGYEQKHSLDFNFPISKNPLISVLVPLFKPSKAKLKILNESFNNLKRDYPKVEFCVLLNGSTDSDKNKVVSALGDSVKYFFEPDNIGFSKGIDLLSEVSIGEVMLLHNDDAKYIKGIDEILKILRKKKVAACVPKVKFMQKFFEISMQVNESQVVTLEPYKKDNDYNAKVFPEDDEHQLNKGKIKIFKISDDTEELYLSSDKLSSIKIFIDDMEIQVEVSNNPQNILKYFSGLKKNLKTFSIINNAGSGLDRAGNYYDIGIFQNDNGQFNSTYKVSALCGCFLFLKRNSLFNRTIFEDNFFAYYEDSFLSKKLKLLNAHLIYNGKCEVEHLHKASKIESIETKLTLNKILLSNKERVSLEDLNHYVGFLNHHYKQAKVQNAETSIHFRRILKDATNDFRYSKKGKASKVFGIYNQWWNSAGGGEFHALKIASFLDDYGTVELLSDRDFSLSSLGKKFDIDISRMRKKIIEEHSLSTIGYDIFVNSSFQSLLQSYANESFYVLSFALDNKNTFLSEYIFLPNSSYTLKWCKKHMEFESNFFKILHPCIQSPVMESKKKDKVILSVGRIHKPGNQHNKNFEFMIDAHKKLNNNYKLIICGSCDKDIAEDLKYLKKLKKSIKGKSIEIHENIKKEKLLNLYSKADIYWHAAGFGADEDLEPHKFEHFGIAPLEAMSYGALPLVYKIGGPADNLASVNDYNFTYKDSNELVKKTLKISGLDEIEKNKLRSSTIKQSNNFSEKAFRENLEEILGNSL